MRLETLKATTHLSTCFDHTHWPASVFNGSGVGDTRFAPIFNGDAPIATLYAARRRTVALLETLFHEVHAGPPAMRMIYESDVAARGVATLTLHQDLPLIDFRDDALAHLGLDRSLAGCSAAHYECTREWASALHGRRFGRTQALGLIWQSRVSELAKDDHPLLADLLDDHSSEVVVLFGDALPTGPPHWTPIETIDDLTAGPGLLLVEQIAELVDATYVAA